MTTRFHVSLKTGKTGLCKATVRDCPVGGKELHFPSEQEARAHYEQHMGSPVPATATIVSKGATAKATALTTNDVNVMRELLNMDKPSVTKELAKNPHLTVDIAKEIFAKGGIVRDTLVNNEKAPLECIPKKNLGLVRGARQGKMHEHIASNPNITDEQIEYFSEGFSRSAKHIKLILDNCQAFKDDPEKASQFISNQPSLLMEYYDDPRVDLEKVYDNGTWQKDVIVNKTSNEKVLLKALKDGRLYDVASNPNAPRRILEVLSKNPESLSIDVAAKLSQNPKIKNDEKLVNSIIAPHQSLVTGRKIDELRTNNPQGFQELTESIKVASDSKGHKTFSINKKVFAKYGFEGKDVREIVKRPLGDYNDTTGIYTSYSN